MANLNPLCDICGQARACISDGVLGALICQNPECFEKAWDNAYAERRCDWCRRLLTEPATAECVNPEHRDFPLCGHSRSRPGWGGCDPSAIEYAIDSTGVRWTLESALQTLDRINVIAHEMGMATTYDQWDDLCVRLRAELRGGA